MKREVEGAYAPSILPVFYEYFSGFNNATNLRMEQKKAAYP